MPWDLSKAWSDIKIPLDDEYRVYTGAIEHIVKSFEAGESVALDKPLRSLIRGNPLPGAEFAILGCVVDAVLLSKSEEDLYKHAAEFAAKVTGQTGQRSKVFRETSANFFDLTSIILRVPENQLKTHGLAEGNKLMLKLIDPDRPTLHATQAPTVIGISEIYWAPVLSDQLRQDMQYTGESANGEKHYLHTFERD